MPLSAFTMTIPIDPSVHPVLFRLELPRKKKGQGRTPESEQKDDAERDEVISCFHCNAPITLQRFGISVNGRHEHAFFNPAGIAFEIRCFRRAPGCMVQGDPTTQFTWFAGHTWQYSLCRSCSAHLGWFFHGRDNSFFALISNKIV